MIGTVHFETPSGEIVRPYEDYGIYLKSYSAPLPDALTYYEELDGRDGYIDLSEWSGTVNFGPRDLTIELRDMHNNYQYIAQKLAGRHLKVMFSDEPGWFYEGRCDSIDRTTQSRVNDLTLSLTCQPWRKRTAYTQSQEYDVSAEPAELTLKAERMTVSPIITVTEGAIEILDEDETVVYTNLTGTQELQDIALTDSPQVFTFKLPSEGIVPSSGKFTLKWRDGVL